MRDRVEIESDRENEVPRKVAQLQLEVQLDIRDLLMDISGRLAEMSARDENTYFRQDDHVNTVVMAIQNIKG